MSTSSSTGAAHPGVCRALLAVVLAASLLEPPKALEAALPPDTAGTWAIESTLRGQKCTATLMLQPTRAPQSVEDMRRGSARYQGICVDAADGSWLVQEGAKGGDSPPRLAWRLDYPRSTVFFSFDVEERPDGALGGRGEVYATPRADPRALTRVGVFDAKRVSTQWDMRNPIVARIVTDKDLPERSTSERYPF